MKDGTECFAPQGPSAFSLPILLKTMKSFSRLPKSLSSKSQTSRRFLPGHAGASRATSATVLPGVDPAERRARRRPWTNFRAEQRARFGLRDHLGLAGAALALALMLSTALAPRANVLDASAHVPTAGAVEVVDEAPAPSTGATPTDATALPS